MTTVEQRPDAASVAARKQPNETAQEGVGEAEADEDGNTAVGEAKSGAEEHAEADEDGNTAIGEAKAGAEEHTEADEEWHAAVGEAKTDAER